MGLVILPAFGVWVYFIVQAFMLGSGILSAEPSETLKVMTYVLPLICTVIYLLVGFAQFKDKKELWVFDIPVFFLFNSVTGGLVVIFWFITLFTDAFSTGWLGLFLQSLYFTAGVGALTGTMFAGTFMELRGIKRSH